MTEKGRRDFCIECRKETEYLLQKKDIVKNIRDKEYTFAITVAVCAECGEEMSIPGLIDKNVQEIDEQYRAAEGLVSIDDIEKLMKIYKIGKAPLSLAPGFGEVTIPRYLEGQVPSKEYSDIMKAALSSPAYMKQKLMENREKLTDAAYRKAFAAAESIESLFSVSDKMLRVIAYIFEKLEEVTPLMLQKLLYFIQGVYSALYGRPIFEEDCRAWVHGPVYPEVYELFRDFKYNPIDANASMGRLKAYRMLGACPYSLLEGKMEFSPIDDSARAVVLLALTPRENVVFHAFNDHLLPMDDIMSRMRDDRGRPLEYVEDGEFVRIMDAAKDDPDKSRVLSSIIAYTQAEGQAQLVENGASTDFSMQVLRRLGFRWDQTSSQYVDMIFDMLSSMRYFED